jgi:hypothetical protein
MKTVALEAFFYRCRYIIMALVFSVGFFFIALRTVDPVEYPNSDFFSFWLAGHMAITGQNPYSSDLWISGHNQFGATWISDAKLLYPLPLSLLFVPLAVFPLYQAFIIWVWLSQLMILVAFVLLLKIYPTLHIKRYLLPLVAGIVLFRPTILTITLGQFSGFLLLVIAAVVYLWEKENYWQGALLLPILLLKPHLGVPIVVLLTVYLLFRKKIIPLAAEFAAGFALIMVGLALNPHWISEFWAAGTTKISQTFGFSPTIWGVSAFFCNYDLNCTIGFGGFFGLLLLLGCLFLLARNHKVLSPAMAAGLAICVTLSLTPYTWTYDQILLIVPIVGLTIGLGQEGQRFLPTALIFLLIDIFAFVMLGITARIQKEIWNAAIPLLVMGLLFWFLSREKHKYRVGGTI